MTDSRERVIEALLTASRAMVAIAGRSLAEVDADVTLPQSRALVVLAARGPQRIVDIAAELGVAPSTATRMCDRLVRKNLARRYRTPADRREVRLSLTPAGRELVRDVTRRRRDELARIIDAIPAAAHGHVTAALQALNGAAGELPERDWWLGPDEEAGDEPALLPAEVPPSAAVDNLVERAAVGPGERP